MKTSDFLIKISKSIDYDGTLKEGDKIELDSLAQLSILALFSELEIKCKREDLLTVKKTDDLIKLAKSSIEDHEK